ncbi:hypothetical protein BI364_06925 [Acidihalobacter yilgarnensis]|uniref:DUF6475 domain-containing protein n=1 Tax=Acidihalobacter yilgarnensis TaxID=2819280 RepID=A0A1D8IMM5_9GAMM|nr:DUF6475 domain-containing protein [Acidihalobacter yilgarnensis]AOU97726.1 hypothetical protein BI364_06925 [Acidihalobacter yilgarnensis]
MNGKQDFERFAAIWFGTQDAYGRTPTAVEVKLAFAALSRWSLDEVTRGIERHFGNPDGGRFPPKPADIIRMIMGGGTEDLALRAWSAVERTIRSIGPYRSICGGDPITLCVIRDMGGWIRLCANQSERELDFSAREFVKRYAAYVAHGGAVEPPDHLPGIQERDAIASCFPDLCEAPVPMLETGNPEHREAIWYDRDVRTLEAGH